MPACYSGQLSPGRRWMKSQRPLLKMFPRVRKLWSLLRSQRKDQGCGSYSKGERWSFYFKTCVTGPCWHSFWLWAGHGGARTCDGINCSSWDLLDQVKTCDFPLVEKLWPTAINHFGRNGDVGHGATETDKVLAKFGDQGCWRVCVCVFFCAGVLHVTYNIIVRDIYRELSPNSDDQLFRYSCKYPITTVSNIIIYWIYI